MNQIQFKHLAVALLAFLVLGFLGKLFVIVPLANFFNVPGLEDSWSVGFGRPPTSFVVALSVSNILIGSIIAKYIASRVTVLPLYHAVAVGLIAAVYRIYRPDLNPLPWAVVVVQALLILSSVVGFCYMFKRGAGA